MNPPEASYGIKDTKSHSRREIPKVPVLDLKAQSLRLHQEADAPRFLDGKRQNDFKLDFQQLGKSPFST